MDPGVVDDGVDLPLLANTFDIDVEHFLLDLNADFHQKCFQGSITLFLQPVDTTTGRNVGDVNRDASSQSKGLQAETRNVDGDFVMILDASNIYVHSVEDLEGSVISPSRAGAVTRSGSIRSEQSKSNASEDSGIDSDTRDQNGGRVDNPSGDSVSTEGAASEINAAGDSAVNNGCQKSKCDAHDNVPSMEWRKRLGFYQDFRGSRTAQAPLKFIVEKWCIRLWKPGVKNVKEFPRIVRINYSTQPDGGSLTWTRDQDGKDCVYTQGAWINNRSLFPCQEPPEARSTWQAFITAPEDFTAIMSGQEDGVIRDQYEGFSTHYYFVTMKMPCSTLALALGQWLCWRLPVFRYPCIEEGNIIKNNEWFNRPIDVKCDHTWTCHFTYSNMPIVPARIFAPLSLLPKTVDLFEMTTPRYLASAFKLLGAHPFRRLDLLVLPRCFASMGLASPSTVFLSQSMLSHDRSMNIRLAHEISHSWFGLLIGASDWSEEWLSEGFATFMEDIIHAIGEKWSNDEFQVRSELRTLIRYRALKTELENTESELQIMRPTGQAKCHHKCKHRFAKNGRNQDKWYTQVHYLKGYFLLHYLSKLVGLELFLRFIREYAHIHHGRLVSSSDFFQLLLQSFPQLRSKGMDEKWFSKEWLDKPGMPMQMTKEQFENDGNNFIKQVKREFQQWKAANKANKSVEKNLETKRTILSASLIEKQKFLPDQMVLLMDYLLELPTISATTIQYFNATYHPARCNAEVRHRWCELIVKHLYQAGYKDVKRFLINDQAMGVYLYGEMMLSGERDLQKIARDCYTSLAAEMDKGCRKTVHAMLYPQASKTS